MDRLGRCDSQAATAAHRQQQSPAGGSAPLASLVNYDGAVQNIANAATIKCYFNAGAGAGAREIEVKNVGQKGISHLVINVMGYYYAAP
jgi:hypothetical protein